MSRPAAFAQDGGALFANTGSTVTIRDDASLARNTARVREPPPGSPSPAGEGSRRQRLVTTRL